MRRWMEELLAPRHFDKRPDVIGFGFRDYRSPLVEARGHCWPSIRHLLAIHMDGRLSAIANFQAVKPASGTEGSNPSSSSGEGKIVGPATLAGREFRRDIGLCRANEDPGA